MDEKYLLSTLVKAKQVLDLFQTHDFITLKQVQEELALSKTTAFRLLYTLNKLDFLNKDGNKYYLKSSFINGGDVQKINWNAIPILKPLVDQVDLSAYIGIVFDNQIVISQVVPAKDHVEDYRHLDESLPLNTTAMGKCALAFLDKDTQEKVMSLRNFRSITKNTLTDEISIKQSLKVIRDQGYALDDEEKELDFRCLATPICKDNKLFAVIGLSGNLDELKRRDIKKLVSELHKKSKEIEMTLL